MYSIAVIGDKDSVAGFGAVGLDVFFADSQTECKRVFKQLVSSEKFAVIFITEKAAEFVSEDIERLSRQILPAVIPIPGVSGNTGRGIEGVKRSVEKAVGSDIIFN